MKVFLWALAVGLLAIYGLSSVVSAGSERAPSISPTSVTVAVPADLGKGRRTPAVKHWMKRLTSVCRDRNRDVWELNIRQESTRPLAARPYAERVLSSWKDFQRASSRLRAPASYAAEAHWIQRVNEAKRQLIETELDAVLAGDIATIRSAERAYVRLSNQTNQGFLRMGLFWCSQFEAQQR